MQENEQQEQGVTLVAPAAGIVTAISANSARLSEVLMANIEKLTTDPKHIPQAEAINAQVKTIIDLGKAELEAYKLSVFMSQK